jgi:hypothetical protein
VEDHEGRVFRSFTTEPCESITAKIGFLNPGLVHGCNSQCGLEVGEPLCLLGPDQCFEPCDLRRVCRGFARKLPFFGQVRTFSVRPAFLHEKPIYPGKI